MDFSDVAIVAGFVVAFALVSRRLAQSAITAPMVFVAFGILVGPEALNLVDLSVDAGAVRTLAEATLVLVLFTDAARIDFRVLRREFQLPARLLGFGMPLTIALGGTVAWLVFDLEIWEAALLGAILAPTDAALGQVVVSSPKVPARVRQALNVESGLNDGIALPVITILIALAGAQEGVASAGFWARFVVEQIGYGAAIGIACGLAGGWLVDRASRHEWMSHTYQQIATLAVAVAAFGAAEAVDGNGFIAAFVAGVAFGTVARASCSGVYEFAESEGQLLNLLTFLVFGAAIAGPALGELDARIALYVVLSLTAIRLLPVAAALVRTGLHLDTVGFVGWFGPRGLASILFGLLVVEEAGLVAGEHIFLIVTWTVLASVFAHGLSAVPGVNWYERRVRIARETRPVIPEFMPATEIPVRIPHPD